MFVEPPSSTNCTDYNQPNLRKFSRHPGIRSISCAVCGCLPSVCRQPCGHSGRDRGSWNRHSTRSHQGRNICNYGQWRGQERVSQIIDFMLTLYWEFAQRMPDIWILCLLPIIMSPAPPSSRRFSNGVDSFSSVAKLSEVFCVRIASPSVVADRRLQRRCRDIFMAMKRTVN